MSPQTNVHAPRTSLSGRIQIGHKSGLLPIPGEAKAKVMPGWLYCLNPNSANSSVQQNLRLDYILTQLSTPPTTTTTNSLLLLLLTAPASQALRLYNHTVTEPGRLYYNRLAAEL
jgi:hypothetical protein